MAAKKVGRKTWFMVGVTAAAVALAAALLMFTVLNGRRITSENREYLVDNATQVAENIDSAISEGYDNIRILSELVSRSLDGPEFDITSIQGLIKNSVFDFMEYADVDGMDHNITGGISDARDRQYYNYAKSGSTGMELIYVSRATHETLLMFYSPLRYNNEFAGSLVGAYQASNKITNLLSSEYFGEPATSYLINDRGRVLASNQSFDARDEIHIKDIVGNNPEVLAELEAAFDTGETVTFSLESNTTGGCMVRLPESGWFVIQIFPQAASNRMISNANRLGYYLVAFLMLLYVLIMIGLVRFYRSQQELLDNARKQAESANDAKTSFLFNMSHDIRTPMNAILGYTDIAMRHSDDPERVDDSLKKIKLSGDHLLNLINDILEMSRIESGKLELAENPMDLRETIRSVNEMSIALAMPKSIEFSAETGEIGNPYVMADELHIKEVLINLISNAVKYTPQGGKVSFRAEQTGGDENGQAAYRFTVADNGIGMSEEFQEHLFEAFSREASSGVSKEEGAGLGLSIVRRIVDLDGGSISVESEPGKGSSFAVEVPLKLMNDGEISLFREKSENENSDAFSKGTELEGRRVLLVEDNEMNREIATDILEETGLTAETAEDGAVAVRKVAEKGAGYYDFILMDIQMPVLNGFEATAEIRRLPGGDSIPIIALSANAFKEDIEKSLEAGMNAHVAKPINVSELIRTLHTLL